MTEAETRESVTRPTDGDGPSGRSASPRRTLDRLVILREAVHFLDEHGRDQLTMRRLGAELGVEAMALYRYVPGREQLLDGVVEYLMDELYAMTITGNYVATWQEFLQQMAHGVRTVAVEHPKIFPLVASRPPSAPWLRPPLRSLRWVEGFLNGLDHYGFSAEESVTVYRSFSIFLLGHLLLEVGTTGGEPEMSAQADIEFFESNDVSNYPRLLGMAAELSASSYDLEFEDSLEDLINRIQLNMH